MRKRRKKHITFSKHCSVSPDEIALSRIMLFTGVIAFNKKINKWVNWFEFLSYAISKDGNVQVVDSACVPTLLTDCAKDQGDRV